MANDEFFNDSPLPSATGPTDPATLDMDALFEMAVNQDEVRQTQADALKPTGSYVTVPDLNIQTSRIQEGHNAGRLMIKFFGPAQLTVTEKNARALKLNPGSIVKGQFGFGISPERANKLKDGVDSGEPDHPSKLWAQAVKTVEEATKAKAGTIGDVVRFIQGFPVVLRVIQVGVPTDRNPEPDGEPGNIVMAISPVREPRS